MLVTTYAAFLRDQSVVPDYWTTVILDEAHYVRNRTTQTFKALKRLHSTALIEVTGTPASRGPQDMWALLHLLDKKHFSSYWRFVNTWCIVDDSGWGKEIIAPRDPDRFKEMVSKRHMFFIARKDLAQYLPPKKRNQIPVEMTPKQERMYRQLETDMYTFLESGELLVASTVLAKITRFRQLLCCPQILDPDCPEVGGAIEYVLDQLDGEGHAAIFTPFTAAIAPIKTAILKRYPKYQVDYLKGGTSPEEMDERVTNFKMNRGVMICSIRFAQSFDLETCNLALFVGRDFDPDKNYQAEDRVARRNTVGSVTIQYPSYEGTYDMESWGILDKKRFNVNAILKTPDSIKAFLKGTS
jgi:SNF2 family DNA or RNA helicase